MTTDARRAELLGMAKTMREVALDRGVGACEFAALLLESAARDLTEAESRGIAKGRAEALTEVRAVLAKEHNQILGIIARRVASGGRTNELAEGHKDAIELALSVIGRALAHADAKKGGGT